MTLTQLNNYFASLFAAQSANPKNYGKSTVDKEIAFEGKYSNGIYSLSCTVGGTRRVKSAGPNAPTEKPWDTSKLTAYFVAKMDAIYSGLTVAQQASFASEYVAIKDFVGRGKMDVAKQIATDTTVTSDLQKAKDSIIGYLTV